VKVKKSLFHFSRKSLKVKKVSQESPNASNVTLPDHMLICFKLEILYMAIREKGKSRDLCMVFKQSFKYLKN